MKTKIFTTLSVDGYIENNINYDEKLLFFNEDCDNILIIDHEKYKKILPEITSLKDIIVILIEKKYPLTSQLYKELTCIDNKIPFVSCINIEEAFKIIEQNKINDEINNFVIVGNYDIYNEAINKCNDINVVWVNIMYDESNESNDYKKFPITKLFSDFEMVSDINWKKNKEDILYKIYNYKFIY